MVEMIEKLQKQCVRNSRQLCVAGTVAIVSIIVIVSITLDKTELILTLGCIWFSKKR